MSAALNLEAERAAFEKCSRLLNPGDSLYAGTDSPVGWHYFDDAINDCWKVWRYARHTAPAVGADGLPALPELPRHIFNHPNLGCLFDRLSMHQYAVRYADLAIAADRQAQQYEKGQK